MATRLQTEQLKKDFLDTFRVQGNISLACRTVGLSRMAIYRWQETDEQFALAYRQAEIEATETLEAEAWRRAVQGDVNEHGIYFRDELLETVKETKRSDTLLIFLLKARNPEKYRDNQHVTHSGTIDFGTIGELLQGRDARSR